MMDPDLEHLIHRELSRLPQPRAPRTLAPRVLRAVQSRPREATGWFTWRLEWQFCSLAAMVLLLAGVLNVGPIAKWATAIASSSGAGQMTWAGDFLQQGANVVGAASVLWRVLIEPVVMFLALFLAAMCAASAAFGAALRSVVLGGTSSS